MIPGECPRDYRATWLKLRREARDATHRSEREIALRSARRIDVELLHGRRHQWEDAECS